MSDVQQQPNEQIHALNTRITTLVNNCRFQDQKTTYTIKLVLLQHAVRFHEARDWICLQDQNQLTYASLLQYCKTLEQRCEQYQKAQIKGRTELTAFSAATATESSVHQDKDNITLNNTQCTRCGYKDPHDNCPAKGKDCYNCHGLNHYTAGYVDVLNRGKRALLGPLADPTIGSIAKADKAVVPLASTGSHATEAPVLPTHIDHHISPEDREALLDLSK